MIINVYWSSYKVHFVLVRLNHEFSLRILAKYSSIKYNENPSGSNRVVSCRRTEVQADTKKILVPFRNFTKASKIGQQYAETDRFRLKMKTLSSSAFV